MSVDHPSLVTQASQGSSVAVEALLARHVPELRVYVHLKAGRAILARESSEDLVQSVCRELLENLTGFEYRGEAAFRQWLFSKATNKILDRARYYRAEKRDVAREVEPPGAETSSSLSPGPNEVYATLVTPSRVAIGREELRRMEVAFQQLPEDYREVILQAKVIGHSVSEIAEQMNRSRGAVRVLLHRALARLTALMDDTSDDNGSDQPAPGRLD